MSIAEDSFSVVNGSTVRHILSQDVESLIDVVRDTYVAHDAGIAINPPSCFLRFSQNPQNRIIALPASLQGENPVSGIKWVSSYPGNLKLGLPRASAIVVLNSPLNGRPFAILESSQINIFRTAASAAIAAAELAMLRGESKTRSTIGFVGTGAIARGVIEILTTTGWRFDRIVIHDSDPTQATGFCSFASDAADCPCEAVPLDTVLTTSELAVFATTSRVPYVADPRLLSHCPVILHISLRDLSPEVILSSYNVVDSVEHCLTAETSLHLTETREGHREFVSATIASLIRRQAAVGGDRPIVVSPFGLGVLDIAVGMYVYQRAVQLGLHTVVAEFF